MDNKIAIVVGRFQPCHKGHQQIFDMLIKNHQNSFIIIVRGNKSSSDKNMNPLSLNDQKTLLETAVNNNIGILVHNTSFIPDVIESTLNQYDNFVLYCGPDRYDEYLRYIKYTEKIGKKLEVKKVDFNRENISGTNVRNSLINDDFEEFKKLMDSRLHKYFETLKDKIKSPD